jgi:hypothetical protein
MAWSDSHEVCLYETMFWAGFRLPFIRIVRELLSFFNLSPHQLSPNAWRTFFGCVILWPMALGKQHNLTMKKFMHLYRLQKNPQHSVVYNVQTKRESSFKSTPSSPATPNGRTNISSFRGSGSSSPLRKQRGPESLETLATLPLRLITSPF